MTPSIVTLNYHYITPPCTIILNLNRAIVTPSIVNLNHHSIMPQSSCHNSIVSFRHNAPSWHHNSISPLRQHALSCHNSIVPLRHQSLRHHFDLITPPCAIMPGHFATPPFRQAAIASLFHCTAMPSCYNAMPLRHPTIVICHFATMPFCHQAILF